MLNAMDIVGLQLFKRLIKDGCRWHGPASYLLCYGLR